MAANPCKLRIEDIDYAFFCPPGSEALHIQSSRLAIHDARPHVGQPERKPDGVLL